MTCTMADIARFERILARCFSGPLVPFARKSSTRKPYEMKALKNDEAEIFLYDVIGDTWDGSGTTAKNFATDLKALGPVKTLNIRINSPGGSVFDGIAIHNVLRRHSARKIVTVDGIAASIASVIMMAGDEISVAANGSVMVHNPWSIAFGEAADFRKAADTLDKIRDSILSTYVDRTTTPEEQISAWMDAETWMSAEEAVDAGFADSIVEEVAIAALAKHDLSTFRHVPEPLAKAAEMAKAEGGENDDTTDETSVTGKPHSAIASMTMRLAKRGIKRPA